MDYKQISAQALAYLGDSVIEIKVREYLIKKGLEKSKELNNESKKFVTAISQNKAYLNIMDLLTEEENDIFKRGRNSNHLNIPKSASITEYKNATGFESVFGYLYLTGNNERIDYLFSKAYFDS